MQIAIAVIALIFFTVILVGIGYAIGRTSAKKADPVMTVESNGAQSNDDTW